MSHCAATPTNGQVNQQKEEDSLDQAKVTRGQLLQGAVIITMRGFQFVHAPE